MDLSGSPQGAGGVGGLLSASRKVGAGDLGAWLVYGGDANGNITLAASVSNGAVVAVYEYGPFGESLRTTGPAALDNPFRFSTKYTDDETGLLYYGYRYYAPMLGRWLSRDPIGEQAGMLQFRLSSASRHSSIYALRALLIRYEMLEQFDRSAMSVHQDVLAEIRAQMFTDIQNLINSYSRDAYLFVDNDPVGDFDYLGLDGGGSDVGSGSSCPTCDTPEAYKKWLTDRIGAALQKVPGLPGKIGLWTRIINKIAGTKDQMSSICSECDDFFKTPADYTCLTCCAAIAGTQSLRPDVLCAQMCLP